MSSPPPATIGDLLGAARRRLAAASFAPAPREAVLLLARALGHDEASVLAHPEREVPAPAAERFRGFLERRLDGEPVAYLFGEREFYGRGFSVDSRVLIPRPETEHLIEAALALVLPPEPLIIDAGTGSGCIAVTLAREIPDARLLATDLSMPALEVAAANARRHRVADRIDLVHTDLTSGLRLDRADLLVSNPPYIDAEEKQRLSVEVRGFEPHLALFPPGRGHSILRRLLDQGVALPPGAHLLIEIGYDQAGWMEAAIAERQVWKLLELVRDYRSIPRTAVLRRQAD